MLTVDKLICALSMNPKAPNLHEEEKHADLSEHISLNAVYDWGGDTDLNIIQTILNLRSNFVGDQMAPLRFSREAERFLPAHTVGNCGMGR
jgi:hypothetical protein